MIGEHMASPSGLNPSVPTLRNSWLARNWVWAAILGVILLLLVAALFVGGILLLVETSFQHSGFYGDALTRARANPQVIAAIGEPIEAGWLASGSVNTSGPSGNADISIPIKGPKGKGTVYVVAKKSAGKWGFQTLQVELAGQADRIDLLKPDEHVPSEN
jgi:hypothetical protein